MSTPKPAESHEERWCVSLVIERMTRPLGQMEFGTADQEMIVLSTHRHANDARSRATAIREMWAEYKP